MSGRESDNFLVIKHENECVYPTCTFAHIHISEEKNCIFPGAIKRKPRGDRTRRKINEEEKDFRKRKKLSLRRNYTGKSIRKIPTKAVCVWSNFDEITKTYYARDREAYILISPIRSGEKARLCRPPMRNKLALRERKSVSMHARMCMCGFWVLEKLRRRLNVARGFCWGTEGRRAEGFGVKGAGGCYFST